MIARLLDFIFPRQCHLCGNSLSDGELYVCAPCLAAMPRTLYHRRRMNPMEQRFAGLFPFENATATFFYSRNSDIANLIHDFKYNHFRGLARYLGKVAADELATTHFLNGVDFIVPIPMHFRKKASRGYNQTEELAKGFSEASGIPVSLDLRAVRSHRTQTSLTLEQRRENTRGIFRLDQPATYAGKHLLLLDDVCTTGSTLVSAAETILAASPHARLSLLTLGATY